LLRVLVLSTRFPDRLRAGFGNFVERQTLELAARPGVAVEVIAPIGRPPFASSHHLDPLPSEECWKGLSVHRPRFARVPFAPGLRAVHLARRLIPLATGLRARFAFDVISAEFSWPEGPAAAALGRRLGVPVVIKARGMEFERGIRGGWTRRQIIAAGGVAQALLAVSADVKETMIAAGLPAGRIRVHYPAVDMTMFRPADRSSAKRRLGVSGPLLLAVGNLIPEKRHRLAVEALRLVEPATLMIVGGGPERDTLFRLASELGVAGRMRLLGSIPHPLLPALFNAADVTLHPSAVEGFGNARLESLACGTPVVTTAAGEARRIIDRPAAGRVVDGDAGALAAAVREILANPPAPETVRAAIEPYTWERQAAELEMHLRDAAASRLRC
jgi:teichuronic acid biosynthesis glycosyltransferase TuaC